MDYYEELSEKIMELKQEDQEPKALILGYKKVGKLEKELGSSQLMYGCDIEEFMKRGAAGKFEGVLIFIDQLNPNVEHILTKRNVDSITKEYQYRKEKKSKLNGLSPLL